MENSTKISLTADELVLVLRETLSYYMESTRTSDGDMLHYINQNDVGGVVDRFRKNLVKRIEEKK